MTSDLPPSRVPMLLGVPLALLIAAAAIFLLARSWDAHHRCLAALAAERANYEELLRDAAALQRAIADLRAAPTERAAFVPSASGPDVQARVSAIVSGSGAALRHVSVELATESEDAPVELRASVRFSCAAAQLARVLYDMRAARPYLFVARLGVHGSTAGRLDVDLVAISYVRAP